MTTGFPDVDARELAALQAQQHEGQQVAFMEHGFGVLGLVQVPQKQNGQLVGFVWAPRGQDQTGNLPTAVVERARAALAAEQTARAIYQAKRDEALSYIAKHGLSSAAAQTYLELACAESWTALQGCLKPTRLAMRDLGQVAERGAQIRQAITSGPRRIAAIEHEAARQIAIIRDELASAELEAMQLGLT